MFTFVSVYAKAENKSSNYIQGFYCIPWFSDVKFFVTQSTEIERAGLFRFSWLKSFQKVHFELSLMGEFAVYSVVEIPHDSGNLLRYSIVPHDRILSQNHQSWCIEIILSAMSLPSYKCSFEISSECSPCWNDFATHTELLPQINP